MVAHFFFFGLQVFCVMWVGRDHDRHVFHDLEAVANETGPFAGVIGKQPDFRDAKVSEYLCAHAVVSFVHFKTKFYIGFYGIHALLLKLVRL